MFYVINIISGFNHFSTVIIICSINLVGAFQLLCIWKLYRVNLYYIGILKLISDVVNMSPSFKLTTKIKAVTFFKKTICSNQKYYQPLPRVHPFWDEFNLDFLCREVLLIPWWRKVRTRVSNKRILIGILCQQGCVLPVWDRQHLYKLDNLPQHLLQWRYGRF